MTQKYVRRGESSIEKHAGPDKAVYDFIRGNCIPFADLQIRGEGMRRELLFGDGSRLELKVKETASSKRNGVSIMTYIITGEYEEKSISMIAHEFYIPNTKTRHVHRIDNSKLFFLRKGGANYPSLR